MDQRVVPAGPDIVFEEFDGDLVVLNLSTGRYFGFNPAAAVVWEALMAGSAPRDVAEAMLQTRGLNEFVAELRANDLVVASDMTPVDLAPSLATKLAALGTAPQLEAYDDLADLIVADPIHDTDEAQGWPVRAPEA
ncbi:PqqD family protein [Sedimentimonas flavescens]|uniref:PqqD family protein n=1 Tax=Sedimentimonas flavescens TaxID=2851012 RepID=UPI001C4A2C27|nr:PqqD family protein [Sedimentimonas flavescens]MBW0159687.1 PqqD family protein [Sedimentimonas flavescens]WBL31727.1 PqqD family protein [Sinirhodobacter sp. HNIBRBA609]